MKTVYYQDKKFSVLPEVYRPAEDTYLLADNLKVEGGEKVLELGTGCGILSIIAAKEGAEVISTDINPKALECARENAKSHGVLDEMDFRKGNLFEPIENEKFDLIIFNPPYLPVLPSESPESKLELAWDGGPNGREIINTFLREFQEYLKPKGRLLFLQSSLSDEEKTLKKLKNEFEVEIEKKEFFFEKIYLFICKKTN